MITRYARLSGELGLELVQLRVRMREGPDGASATACCASSTPPGAAW